MTDPTSPSTREQAIALLKRGLDKALQMAAARYVMPIYWISAENGRPLILGNGSAFMDLGARCARRSNGCDTASRIEGAQAYEFPRRLPRPEQPRKNALWRTSRSDPWQAETSLGFA